MSTNSGEKPPTTGAGFRARHLLHFGHLWHQSDWQALYFSRDFSKGEECLHFPPSPLCAHCAKLEAKRAKKTKCTWNTAPSVAAGTHSLKCIRITPPLPLHRWKHAFIIYRTEESSHVALRRLRVNNEFSPGGATERKSWAPLLTSNPLLPAHVGAACRPWRGQIIGRLDLQWCMSRSRAGPPRRRRRRFMHYWKGLTSTRAAAWKEVDAVN